MTVLVLCNSSLVGKSLSGGGDQGNNIRESFAEQFGVGDGKEDEGLIFLRQTLTKE